MGFFISSGAYRCLGAGLSIPLMGFLAEAVLGTMRLGALLSIPLMGFASSKGGCQRHDI